MSMEPGSDFRAAIAKAVAGRSVAGSATSSGMPRDAIRNVLQGHDPKLTRADEICRALGISFTIGATDDPRQADRHLPGTAQPPSDSGGGLPASTFVESDTVDAECLDALSRRLADLWIACNPNQRRHLTRVITAILDLAGAVRPPAPSAAPPE